MSKKVATPVKVKPRMRLHRYPVLIQLEEKHTTSRYLANDASEKRKIGLEIVKSWMDQKLLSEYDMDQNFDKYVKEETGYHFEALLEMKKTNKNDLKVQLSSYGPVLTIEEHIERVKKNFSDKIDHMKICQLAKECVKTKDGAKAWEIIDFCTEREYTYQKVEERMFDNVDYVMVEVKA